MRPGLLGLHRLPGPGLGEGGSHFRGPLPPRPGPGSSEQGGGGHAECAEKPFQVPQALERELLWEASRELPHSCPERYQLLTSAFPPRRPPSGSIREAAVGEPFPAWAGSNLHLCPASSELKAVYQHLSSSNCAAIGRIISSLGRETRERTTSQPSLLGAWSP